MLAFFGGSFFKSLLANRWVQLFVGIFLAVTITSAVVKRQVEKIDDLEDQIVESKSKSEAQKQLDKRNNDIKEHPNATQNFHVDRSGNLPNRLPRKRRASSEQKPDRHNRDK